MNEIICTKHGQSRMQQRGIRKEDVRLVQECGTQVDDDTWLMRKRDAIREIEIRKREIQRLERLRNHKVVIRDERVVTAYPSRPSDQKLALRRGRGKGLVK